MSYLCLDRNIKGGRKNKFAFFWLREDGMYREVNRWAYVVAIYGVIFTVVFSDLSGSALAQRI